MLYLKCRFYIHLTSVPTQLTVFVFWLVSSSYIKSLQICPPRTRCQPPCPGPSTSCCLSCQGQPRPPPRPSEFQLSKSTILIQINVFFLLNKYCLLTSLSRLTLSSGISAIWTPGAWGSIRKFSNSLEFAIWFKVQAIKSAKIVYKGGNISLKLQCVNILLAPTCFWSCQRTRRCSGLPCCLAQCAAWSLVQSTQSSRCRAAHWESPAYRGNFRFWTQESWGPSGSHRVH